MTTITKKLKNNTAKNSVSKPGLAKAEPTKPAPIAASSSPTVTPVAAAPSAPSKTATTAIAPVKTATPKAGHVTLELLKPGATSVCVAGSFNGWKPEKTPLVRIGSDKWVGDLWINPGRYEYLFVVDGQWVPDPNAKESVQNPFGGTNSVLFAAV